MFHTQIYGTNVGGLVDYAVMKSIVNCNSEVLAFCDGIASCSGASMQAYNTNAASWALSRYLYQAGAIYDMVPIGLAIGFGLVVIHRIIVYVCSTSHLG